MAGAGLAVLPGFAAQPTTAELADGGDTALFLLQKAIPSAPLLDMHGLLEKHLGRRLFRQTASKAQSIYPRQAVI